MVNDPSCTRCRKAKSNRHPHFIAYDCVSERRPDNPANLSICSCCRAVGGGATTCSLANHVSETKITLPIELADVQPLGSDQQEAALQSAMTLLGSVRKRSDDDDQKHDILEAQRAILGVKLGLARPSISPSKRDHDGVPVPRMR